jgi:radical SAM superfamily enzyme YgiQ (UPF0313 family)
MKNVLFVYPEIPSTYWSFKYTLPFIRKKAAFPPLGLMTLAAMFPREINIRIIDMNTENFTRKDLKGIDTVFISAMIIQKKSMFEVIKLCKKTGVKIIAGGPYPTTSYKEIADVDHFVLNEAEVTLPEFFQDYENGTLKPIYSNEDKPDITTTPTPRFDLINVNKYSNMAIQFSRGCPFNCEFCDIIEMLGRVPRTKNIDQFIRELDAVYESGFRGSLFIVDDNFIGNKKKVKKLLPEVIKWQKAHKYPFTLFTEASINLGDDTELLELMKQAAFDMVFVGIETPDADTLAATHKSQNARIDMNKNIEKIQKYGIEVTGGFIIGFDSDTPAIFDSQINFIQKNSIPLAMVGMLIALPKTQLYRRLKKENRLLKESNGNNTHDLTTNFKTVLPQKVLVDGYKKIIKKLYSPKLFFERSLNVLKKYPKDRITTSGISFIDIYALFRSLFIQTFSRYGFTYLKFLFKILKHDFRLFPDAIRAAVKGHHFFKITDDILKLDEFSHSLNDSIISFKNKVVETFSKENSTAIFNTIISLEKRLQKDIKKKYHKLSKNIQVNLVDSMHSIEKYCNSLKEYWYDILTKNINLNEVPIFPENFDSFIINPLTEGV